MHGAIIVAAVILLTAAASSEVLAQGIGAGSKNATTATPTIQLQVKEIYQMLLLSTLQDQYLFVLQ